MDSYEANGFGLWAIERIADGAFLGDCGPMLQPVANGWLPEIGYHLIRRAWGQWLCDRGGPGLPRLALPADRLRPRLLHRPPREPAFAPRGRARPSARRDDHLGAHGYAPMCVLDDPRAARRALDRGPRDPRLGSACRARRGAARRSRYAGAGRHRSAGMSRPPRRRPPRPRRGGSAHRRGRHAHRRVPRSAPGRLLRRHRQRPTVSTTSTAGTSTSKATRRPMTRTGRGPSVSRMTVGPRASSALAAASGASSGMM